MQAAALIEAPWREPLGVLSALADAPWTIGFLSGGPEARWSYVAAEPEDTLIVGAEAPGDAFAALQALHVPGEVLEGGPPFQGGVAGLMSYELGDHIEALGLGRLTPWPDLACARYPALLAFDHAERRLWAIGRGVGRPEAEAAGRRALAWLGRASPAAVAPNAGLTSTDADGYEAAVAQVVARIGAGEIFQANIARRWRGVLAAGARPVDVLERLASRSPAPFAAYLRLAELAVVSNSPERFLRVTPDAGAAHVETWPIKGTAPRGATTDEDLRLASELERSPKDRAENLMIVDLMRNDLSRVCRPGTVRTPELFSLASFANVHHLVSKVTGELAPGRTSVDLLRAAFPPGSITGAPKVQAMKVIGELEAPRGPFFGSMFHLGVDGALDSNVLIRTAAFQRQDERWEVECRAGAGIVADSEPGLERRETEAKVAALAAALG